MSDLIYNLAEIPLVCLVLLAAALIIYRQIKLNGRISQITQERDSLSRQVELLEERYELVTTNIAAAVVIETYQGVWSFCSPYSEVLTGYDLDVLSTPGFFDSLVLEEDREIYNRARSIANMGEDHLVRYRIRHRSGVKLWLETRYVPVISNSGETELVLSVSIDVTSSVNYQHQIEEHNSDLTDFASMVSHDLKAPIFSIKGMAHLLKEESAPVLPSDGIKQLEYILEATDRLEALVSSVLEYSALSTQLGSDGETDLNIVLANVAKDMGEKIRQSGAIVEIDPEFPKIRGEEIRIYQVFSNLLGNALKYAAPERTPMVRISTKGRNSTSLIVEVSDNGRGIPEKGINNIFRPFYRAHGKEIEGSGIGLACVKKIVDRIGGSISVKSQVGVGSSFIISLPLTTSQAQQIPAQLERIFSI